MSDIGEFELIVDSKDVSGVDAILTRMPDVQTTRARPSRAVDPATIIGIVGGVVSLINGLIELKRHLSQKKNAAPVVIRDIRGRTIDLGDATVEELRAFLASQAT